jgi:putative DNA-invertase from lambdoid prophage Rac
MDAYRSMVPDGLCVGIIAICPLKHLLWWTLKSSRQDAGYTVVNLEGKSGQLRAAIYCRVSTNDQRCDRQESDLKIYADRCGYDVVQIYRETGSGAKLDRVERKKVIQLARSRAIDIILVSELTRWGRSTIDLIDSLTQLQSWGVSLIAQNGFQFDLSTPHGKMIASIMATLAEFERDLLKERVKSGIANARSRGKVFGRPVGGKIADSCDRINELRAQKMSVRNIAIEVGLSKSAIAKCPRCAELPEGLDF